MNSTSLRVEYFAGSLLFLQPLIKITAPRTGRRDKSSYNSPPLELSMPHTISRTATAEKRTEERIFPFARSLSANRLCNDFSFPKLSGVSSVAGARIKSADCLSYSEYIFYLCKSIILIFRYFSIMSNRKKVMSYLSTIVFILGTIGLIWTCSNRQNKKKAREVSYPQTDIIEDKESLYDSVVHYTKDSVVFFKDGRIVGFSSPND